ncbi:single-stranded-DNA-specific exonuclease RecJ [Thalassotalea eurytherma]|uniref:Single-stranded-DNA-specific exonuclease RecJ n=1 Tax=Thalassotalea eurytherma TaxID=1144278 RepID=A0ABQ6H620_9GAMM|nr:single-stranded-DNA-specific exonuclease RecJ [Thalassotalea eurytherma]GLX83598.1 ssDNA exonuclease RecJ [Thalassotalea eurytherma]
MQKQIIQRTPINDQHIDNNIHPIIKQIYAQRGVKHNQELSLKVSQLADVNALEGITLASKLLHDAIVDNQQIFIIGDFDADGATSTALMMEGLSLFGYQHHQFLVPNRFEYGYGLSPEIVEIAHQQGAQTLVTVDSGISCHAGVEKAKSLGLTVIITDHHLPGNRLPKADAIVNPNLANCQFPSKALAGVGVAFYLMLALRKTLREQDYFTNNGITEPNIAQLLDLVALGTVADVVPLDANNRILVQQGLNRIRAGYTRPGIQALIEIAKRDQSQLVASDFGFAIGPRINAAGRLDDMSFGINCLLANDISSARMMATELDGLNKSRREIEQGMQVEAEAIMSRLKFDQDNLPFAIALFQEDWHQGVIGIVAGRIKEKFHRPTIVFAPASDDNTQEIKGSARSIEGLHIRDLLEHISSNHEGLILKFGGHAMAAGLSIKTERFDEFQQRFDHYAQQWIKAEDLQGKLFSDGQLAITDFSLEFAQLIRDSGPWGQHFPEPLFDDEFILVQQRIVGEKHLKLVVQKDDVAFDAIAFNVDIKAWPNHQAQRAHIAFKLDINEFRGRKNLQLMVENITAL